MHGSHGRLGLGSRGHSENHAIVGSTEHDKDSQRHTGERILGKLRGGQRLRVVGDGSPEEGLGLAIRETWGREELLAEEL